MSSGLAPPLSLKFESVTPSHKDVHDHPKDAHGAFDLEGIEANSVVR